MTPSYPVTTRAARKIKKWKILSRFWLDKSDFEIALRASDRWRAAPPVVKRRFMRCLIFDIRITSH
jgi:hypothetical protein